MKNKTIYFLFGEQAVRSYSDGGLKQLIKDGNIDDSTIYAHPENGDVFNLLDAFNGCFDFIQITKKDFDIIDTLQK